MPNLTQALGRLTESALQLVFPLKCIGCHREGSPLCEECVAAAPALAPPYCQICAQPASTRRCRRCRDIPLAVDGIRAPFLMEGDIRSAIHNLKYGNFRAMAPTLGRILAQYLESHPIPGEILVPVPLHPRRLRSRGYNQSALLAREVGKLTGMPVAENLLVRSKNTPPQVQSSALDQRRANVADAFECRRPAPASRALLVDDVTTTGGTLSACAAALKRAGAESVWAIALAKEA